MGTIICTDSGLIGRKSWGPVIKVPLNENGIALCKQMQTSKNATLVDEVNRWRRRSDGNRLKPADELLQALDRVVQLDEQDKTEVITMLLAFIKAT